MTLQCPPDLLKQIQAHGESAYPEEGAGFLLGKSDRNGRRRLVAVLPLINARESSARRNRYLIGPADYLRAEAEADRLGLDVIGVFHSHPDHPDQPSEFDREWAMPWFSYVITSIQQGVARSSRSWRLKDNRSGFEEEGLVLEEIKQT